MITVNSPWYFFAPEGPGWLDRQEHMGFRVTDADVQRVLDYDPGHASDPRMAKWIERLENGSLRMRGRPKKDPADLAIARMFYHAARELIRDMRRSGEMSRVRGNFSAYEFAAQWTQATFRLPQDWKSLFNAFWQLDRESATRVRQSCEFFMKESASRD